jgi:hypothetical protein
MRRLTDHKVNPANDRLEIDVLDEPGAGGANHLYRISGFDTSTNGSDPFQDTADPRPATHGFVLFQNGPIGEKGVNGVTQEALLAIVADRLQCFQDGPFACEENQLALEHVRAAQVALLSRTRGRMARGVEGTHER